MPDRTLTPREVAKAYDRIGRLQDWQGFYEGPAKHELERYADFEAATSVFELGCGTGAYAGRLLHRLLPDDASYMGVDVSGRMIELASARLEPFGNRARLDLVAGHPPFPVADGSFDRFLAAYVFDLLSDELAAGLLDEARRLLKKDGLLCLVSLGEGTSKPSRAVSSLWRAVWRRSPSLVGGCRPIELRALLDHGWQLDHVASVTAWAITSQIVVARPI